MLKQYIIAIPGSAEIPEPVKQFFEHTLLNNASYRVGKYARSYKNKCKQLFI